MLLRIVISVLALSICHPSDAQIQYKPLTIDAKPGSPAPTTCLKAYAIIKPQVDRFPHPSDWQFILACTDRDWTAAMRHAGHDGSGKIVMALTSQRDHITYVNVQAILHPPTPEWSPDHVVAHELAHIYLRSGDEDRVDQLAQDWLQARPVLVQTGGGR